MADFKLDLFLVNLTNLEDVPESVVKHDERLSNLLELVINNTTWTLENLALFSMKEFEELEDLIYNYDPQVPDRGSLLMSLVMTQIGKDNLRHIQVKQTPKSIHFF